MSMKRSSPDLIQQQIYTRERSGIFRATEGFDTVAVSDGLDAVFIKKQLHPFCGYDAPAELVARGEKNDASYPPAIHLFHTEGGDTVLGRSVYQSADFTGLRSAFLTHNYIIPAARQDEIVTHYRDYLEAAFAEKYVPEIGRQLPELEHIPQNPRYAQEGLPRLMAEKLLHELKLDEKTFKRLLFAVMTAAGEGRKKVYVALDVPEEQISEAASALLQVLFACLPFELRRRLGFITYVKEPQSRKFIHLQFVERGSLRPNDREIEKDYVFDLASGRVPQDELDEGRQPYLDMVWKAIGDLSRLEEFHRFADEMLTGMEPQRRLLLSSYHELSVFFQIEAGNWDLYEVHKMTVLRGLLSYLEPAGALESRIRLNDIFLASFDREFDAVKQRNVPDLAVVECFRDYYRLDSRSYGIKLINYLIYAIGNALVGDKPELARSLYGLVESQPELSKTFFDLVLKNSDLESSLFEPYILTKLEEARGAREVLNVVHSWVVAHPGVLRNAAFKEYAVSALADKLRKEQPLLPAVHMVLDNLRKWGRTPVTDRGMTLADSELAENLSLTAKRVLLDELELDKLTREQIVAAEFLARPDAFAGLLFEGRQRNHVDMLQALYEWFAQRDASENIFDGLPSADVEQMQKLGRKWLQSSIEPAHFGKIVLAFYDSKSGQVDYKGLLDYLQRNTKDLETIYEFMLWSQGQPLFAHARGIVPSYTAALLNYFKTHDRTAFKNRDYRTRYFDKAGAPLAAVFAKIRLELSSPFKRFLAQNGKKVRMSAIILLAGLVIIAGILIVMQQQGMLGGAKPPTEAASPPAAVTEPEVLVYADNVTDADGEETTSLVLLFAGAEKCKTFDPAAISIEAPDQTVQQFANLKFDAYCADGTGTAGDSVGNGASSGAGEADSSSDGDGSGAEGAGTSGSDGTSGSGGSAAGSAGSATNGGTGSGTTASGAAGSGESAGTTDGSAGNTGGQGAQAPQSGQGSSTDQASQGSGTSGQAGASATDASGNGQAGDPNATQPEEASNDVSDGKTNGETKLVYSSRVTVSLGQKVSVPVGSVIKVGDQQYTVITREEAEAKAGQNSQMEPAQPQSDAAQP
ncbi:glycosyltransferase [Paenibacillus lentus]|uniref:Glycosyltransferase n=2 Tax=Paenibacillus lentus TaxID=1338368 RepID=A0A3Q8S8M1_9BACL|nr:glycosyltransferase [Paenibacillus lentus]